MDKVIFETTLAGFSIQVTRNSRATSFEVRYGMQTHSGLSRVQARIELGACIFHALQCEGKLDPQSKSGVDGL